MSDLKEHVLSIIKIIETGIDEDGNDIDTCEYMESVMDITWILNNDKAYKGSRLLVAFGGPNIWIDLEKKEVQGHWWSESFTASFRMDAMGLDDYMNDLFYC